MNKNLTKKNCFLFDLDKTNIQENKKKYGRCLDFLFVVTNNTKKKVC